MNHAGDEHSILVVGCGYLGLRVVRAAANLGWTVYGTSRREARRAEIEAAGGIFVHFDITDPSTHINLPAVAGWLWSPAFDRQQGLPIEEVVIRGLENSVTGATSPPDRLVFISTTGVYHQSSGEWVDEKSETRPAGDSGRAHLKAEAFVQHWATESARSGLILRLSGLYGPGRWIRRKSIEQGEPIACDPDSWLNLLHIDDATSACLAALASTDAHSASGLYCVTDDQPVLRRDFYELSARLLNAPKPNFVAPSPSEYGGNRRVLNRQFKTDFNWQPKYPNIETGLLTCI